MKYFLLTFLILLLFLPLNGEDASSEVKRYFMLRKKYIDWRNGFFGSKNVHRRALLRYLWSIYNKRIKTGYDYILTRSAREEDPEIICKIASSRWLVIRAAKTNGFLNKKYLKSVLKKQKDLPDKWWRTKKFLSVSGIIKKFKLDYNKNGDIILLYLDKITLHQ